MTNLDKKAKILTQAETIFLRYGYKRVTMQDIADACQISRPALYLFFANKEAVFKAVIIEKTNHVLQRIRAGLNEHTKIEDKLFFIFDLWTIEPYEHVHHTPHGAEIVTNCLSFAKEIFEDTGKELEVIVANILKPLCHGSSATITAKSIARLLRHSIRGLKEGAEDVKDLRRQVKRLIQLVLQGML